MDFDPRPLHLVCVYAKLVSGVFPLTICSEVPIHGVSTLLGNDIAGGKVTPSLEVLDSPHIISQTDDAKQLNNFYLCIIMRAQSRRRAKETVDDDVDLTDTLFSKFLADEVGLHLSWILLHQPQ